MSESFSNFFCLSFIVNFTFAFMSISGMLVRYALMMKED